MSSRIDFARSVLTIAKKRCDLGDWSFGTLPDYVDLTRKNGNKRVLHSIYPYLDVSAAKNGTEPFCFQMQG